LFGPPKEGKLEPVWKGSLGAKKKTRDTKEFFWGKAKKTPVPDGGGTTPKTNPVFWGKKKRSKEGKKAVVMKKHRGRNTGRFCRCQKEKKKGGEKITPLNESALVGLESQKKKKKNTTQVKRGGQKSAKNFGAKKNPLPSEFLKGGKKVGERRWDKVGPQNTRWGIVSGEWEKNSFTLSYAQRERGKNQLGEKRKRKTSKGNPKERYGAQDCFSGCKGVF